MKKSILQKNELVFKVALETVGGWEMTWIEFFTSWKDIIESIFINIFS